MPVRKELRMFTILDWIVLVFYILFSVGVGMWASRGSNKGFGEYMRGGGSMPWFAIGISLIATSVSATTFLGNPAEAYSADMSFLMNNIGALIAIIVVGVVFIPRIRRSGISSAYELLKFASLRLCGVWRRSFTACTCCFGWAFFCMRRRWFWHRF